MATQGKLLVKSIHDGIDRENDGVRILVTRYPVRVRGFKKGTAYDVWFSDLGPYPQLLDLWHEHKITPEQFTKLYLQYIESRDSSFTDTGRQLDDIRALLAEGKNVTLLCFEPHGQFCHRHVLKHYIETGCYSKKGGAGSS